MNAVRLARSVKQPALSTIRMTCAARGATNASCSLKPWEQSVRVELTKEQEQQLEPLFADVTNAANLGLMGMLVAQVGKDCYGRAFMTVGFIRHAQAKHLVHAATEQLHLPTGDDRA